MAGTISIKDSEGEIANFRSFGGNSASLEKVKAMFKAMYGKKYSEDLLVIEHNKPTRPKKYNLKHRRCTKA